MVPSKTQREIGILKELLLSVREAPDAADGSKYSQMAPDASRWVQVQSNPAQSFQSSPFQAQSHSSPISQVQSSPSPGQSNPDLFQS